MRCPVFLNVLSGNPSKYSQLHSQNVRLQLDPQRASAPCNLVKSLPVPHVDLGAGLLQYADNRPTIIKLVGMVAVGMVPAPRCVHIVAS